MRRLQLFKFKDQPWLPAILREGLAAFAAAQHRLLKSSRAFAAIVDKVCFEAGTTHVVDLESGAGGPFLSMVRELRAQAPRPWTFVLTDRRPNRHAAAKVSRRGDDGVRYELDPIDAALVPDSLHGVRTFVASFHDLPPAAAQAALRDAFAKRQAICVLEITKNAALPVVSTLVVPLIFLLLTPLCRPWRWQQLLLTYLFPLLPLLATWDAFVAHRRTYSRAAYETLTRGLVAADFLWTMHTIRIPGLPYELDCLIGTPIAMTHVVAA